MKESTHAGALKRSTPSVPVDSLYGLTAIPISSALQLSDDAADEKSVLCSRASSAMSKDATSDMSTVRLLQDAAPGRHTQRWLSGCRESYCAFSGLQTA